MRTGSSEIVFRGHRDQSRPDSRQTKARKSRHYRFDLEGLELRTLAGHDTGRSADKLSVGQPVTADGEWSWCAGGQPDRSRGSS